MLGIRHRHALVFAGLICGAHCTAALAQSLPGKIEEDYGGVYAQSGVGAVVGVLQGQFPDRANLQKLRILLPASDTPRQVCFNAATFDGTYSAKGVLSAPARAAGSLSIGDPNYSQHTTRVARYAGDELAVGLVLSRDCNLKPEPVFVPATYGGPLDVVHVALNTKPTKDLRATLTSSSKVSFAGSCEPVRSEKTAAFLQVCAFRIDPSKFAGGLAELRISRQIGNAPRRGDPVSVYIAAAN